MKARYSINLHKGLTFLVVLGLMIIYQNFSNAAWVYLALHGSYGIMWLLKDWIYPDKSWDEEIPIFLGITTFFIVGLYWVAPFILISQGKECTPPLIAAAIATNLFGIFLHYVADAQKYYTLKYHSGLITEGLFAKSRNPNYLGEILTYTSFAMLSQHWLPFLILGFFISLLFIPRMLKKDQSLARYNGFEEYQNQSGLILPIFWKVSTKNSTINQS
ncbi:MAG TPA: steroid 5-alpha reductase [Cyanothece sp. UBA12306]|nr:steroid 5-alpha reductase [Cyanothece sp. UBA12306]